MEVEEKVEEEVEEDVEQEVEGEVGKEQDYRCFLEYFPHKTYVLLYLNICLGCPDHLKCLYYINQYIPPFRQRVNRRLTLSSCGCCSVVVVLLLICLLDMLLFSSQFLLVSFHSTSYLKHHCCHHFYSIEPAMETGSLQDLLKEETRK